MVEVCVGFCAGFCGEKGRGSVIVDADADEDAASEILCVSALFESTEGVEGGFWLNIGRALACSILTSVLA